MTFNGRQKLLFSLKDQLKVSQKQREVSAVAAFFTNQGPKRASVGKQHLSLFINLTERNCAHVHSYPEMIGCGRGL